MTLTLMIKVRTLTLMIKVRTLTLMIKVRTLTLMIKVKVTSSYQKLSNNKTYHQSITYCYKVVHVESLLCTKLGQCQVHNFITKQRIICGFYRYIGVINFYTLPLLYCQYLLSSDVKFNNNYF